MFAEAVAEGSSFRVTDTVSIKTMAPDVFLSSALVDGEFDVIDDSVLSFMTKHIPMPFSSAELESTASIPFLQHSALLNPNLTQLEVALSSNRREISNISAGDVVVLAVLAANKGSTTAFSTSINCTTSLPLSTSPQLHAELLVNELSVQITDLFGNVTVDALLELGERWFTIVYEHIPAARYILTLSIKSAKGLESRHVCSLLTLQLAVNWMYHHWRRSCHDLSSHANYKASNRL